MTDAGERSRKFIPVLITLAVHLAIVFIFYFIRIITPIPPFEIKPVPELEVELELGDGGGLQGTNINPDEPGGGGQEIGKQTSPASQEILKVENGADVKVYSQPKAEGDAQNPPTEDPFLKSLSDKLGQTGVPGPGQGLPNSTAEGVGWSPMGDDGQGLEGSGRKILSKPRIRHNSQEGGTVMVDIIVNREGEVIYAKATLKGSSTTDDSLWRQAEEEASRIKFNPNPSGPAKARGRIKITFEVN